MDSDPFGSAFGNQIDLGGAKASNTKTSSKDPFGGWDNDDPIITSNNDPFGSNSTAAKKSTGMSLTANKNPNLMNNNSDPFADIMGGNSSSKP